MYAPVIVFAYNRPDHLSTVLQALSKNRGAANHDLYIFVDGPKTEEGKPKQDEVVKAAKKYKDGFFKSVKLTVSERNKGLARSVISGVTSVIEKYGCAVIVEDDSVSSPGFLEFMNSALEYYKNDPTVWSIGGYTVPVSIPSDYKYDIIKTQRASSYAWATWLDRWNKIDWELGDYKKFIKSVSLRRKFNLWGNDKSVMLSDQINGTVDSWAIRFDYAMFKNNMYNIVPRKSLIKTIGHDGSGTHNNLSGGSDRFSVELDNAGDKIRLENIETDERIRKEFCKPFALPLTYRAKQFLKSYK